MPRKYLRQELEIRAGEKKIYVYNKHGDYIRTHNRSYTPKDWVIIPTDMPAEYKDYGYWNVPYFQQKASAVGPSTRALIDAVIRKYAYPVQSFRSCFGILRYVHIAKLNGRICGAKRSHSVSEQPNCYQSV